MWSPEHDTPKNLKVKGRREAGEKKKVSRIKIKSRMEIVTLFLRDV